MSTSARARGACGVLEVEAVEAAYGPFLALSGVTLRVGPGEIVALLGPNGAGKTTLIRCVTGLLVPRAGRIRFGGAEIVGRSEERRVGKECIAVCRSWWSPYH